MKNFFLWSLRVRSFSFARIDSNFALFINQPPSVGWCCNRSAFRANKMKKKSPPTQGDYIRETGVFFNRRWTQMLLDLIRIVPIGSSTQPSGRNILPNLRSSAKAVSTPLQGSATALHTSTPPSSAIDPWFTRAPI